MPRERRPFTEGYRKMKFKAVSGIMVTLLLIGMLTLVFNKALIVYTEDIVLDHKENFQVRDCWCSTRYEDLPAGSTIVVSWRADLGWAIGTVFLVAEEELIWLQLNELHPIQSQHSLAEADIEDDVEGGFSFTLSCMHNNSYVRSNRNL